ncbi:hypothetical protein FH039_01660 [Thermococcus indicus]|uniref:CARDB domain-containing protein n=1 Tax=Thermococcus indicus TaxID=2586643 RepID=A0A4Y5SKA3_9EURY|nr:CARDB domain-containing protein [Thermococcus indicus]QDA30579.1 hypothetical protein FH039_01660 [Thermococcus indicus]
MIRRRAVLASIILAVLLGSAIPASASIGFGFESEQGIQVFGGSFRDVYALGDNVTVFAVLWRINKGPIQGAEVTIKVYYEDTWEEPVKEFTLETDANGFAKATFKPEETGRYIVQACYGNVCSDRWNGDFKVVKVEDYYFTPKNIITTPNSTVTLKWTLIEPFTRIPYSKPVNLTISGLDVEEKLTPKNGTVTYTLNLSELSPTSTWLRVYLDGREAANIRVVKEEKAAHITGTSEVKEGDNATVVLFLYNPFTLQPLSGKVNITFEYTLKNWSRVSETREINVRDGYAVVNLNTNGTRYIDIYTRGVELPGGFHVWVNPKPELEGKIPEVRFEIEPEKQIAYPGQSITLVIRGYNTTDNSPPKGNYTMRIEWWAWDGRGWGRIHLSSNETKVYFGDRNEVMRRIKVPENAYWGEITLGNARSRVYIPKPTLWAWGYSIPAEYNETTHTFQVENNTIIGGALTNRTKDWWKEWAEYYKPLTNETVHIFYWNGTTIVRTNEWGYFRKEVPANIDKDLPIAFSIDGDTQKQYVLTIHKSGAWDTAGITIHRDTVAARLAENELWISKIRGSAPAVVEVMKAGTNYWDWDYHDREHTGIILSKYLTSSDNLTVTLKPGIYEIRVLPNEWLSLKEGRAGKGGGLFTHRILTVFPENTSFLEKDWYTTDRTGFIEIPVKLPSKGVFFVRYWNDGYRFYFNETDENGNGVVKIYVPTGQEWFRYDITYGFVTEKYAFVGLGKDIEIRVTEDTQPPAIDLRVLPEVQDVGKNVTISLDVRDTSGVDTVKVEVTNITDTILNKTITAGGDSEVTHEFNFTIRALEDYMVKVWANDTRGNSIYRITNFFGRVREEKRMELENNETHEINVANTTEIAINANDNKSVTVNVTVSSEIENDTAKFKMEGEGYEDLKYVKVETNETINYNWVILNLTYDESVLKRLGIPESAVTLFYWNGSEWIDLSESVGKTIPDNSPYGNITVFGFGRDEEGNYVWANVSHLSEYTLAVKLPDLTVVSISPATAYAGEDTTVKVTIKNLGGPTEKPFKLALYVDETIQDIKQVDGIGSGETRTVEFSWKPPTNKTYVLRAVVDYGDQVTESNETNNEASSLVTVVNREQASPKHRSGGGIATLNFIYYRYYSLTNATFEKLLAQANESGVDNETIKKALEYRELAERWYSQAEAYGPIILNLANPKVLPPLRNAYLNLMKAVKLLENALAGT